MDWIERERKKRAINYFVLVAPVHRLINCSCCHFVASSPVHVALAPCSGSESCHRQWVASKWDRWIHATNPLRCRPTDIHEIRSLYQRHQHRATFRRHAPRTPVLRHLNLILTLCPCLCRSPSHSVPRVLIHLLLFYLFWRFFCSFSFYSILFSVASIPLSPWILNRV